MRNLQIHRNAESVFSGVICSLILWLISTESVFARLPSYEDANIEEAEQVLGIFHQPEVSMEIASELENAIELTQIQMASQDMVDNLNEARTEWIEMTDQMDRGLAEVIHQAERDSLYRSWATFFRLVGVAARTWESANQFSQKQDQQNDSTQKFKQTESKKRLKNDELAIPKEGVFYKYKWRNEFGIIRDGNVEVIHIEKGEGFIEDGKKDGAILLTPGKDTGLQRTQDILGSVTDMMFNQLEIWHENLDQQSMPNCFSDWGGCTMWEIGDDQWEMPLTSTPQRLPTAQEKQLYHIIADAALDWTPIGDVATLITGRDLVEDKKASRLGALAMLSAGGGMARPVIKGMKNLRKMKFKEVVKLLEDNGWFVARWKKSSHRQYKHPEKSGTITVAGQDSHMVPPGTLNSILKQAGLKN